MNKATCLSLLSNAALVWNTVQMSELLTSYAPAARRSRMRSWCGFCPWRSLISFQTGRISRGGALGNMMGRAMGR